MEEVTNALCVLMVIGWRILAVKYAQMDARYANRRLTAALASATTI